MAKLLLHIGGHKTGTSFLQGTFYRNRRLLARHGVHYPAIGPNDAHHALASVWLETSDIPASFFPPGGPPALWDRLIDEYAGREGVVVLSAENFCRAQPQSVDMADLAHRTAAFEEVRVVYTMRRQTELVQSLWSQIAKNRNAPTLRAYVARAIDDHMGGGLWIDHNDVYDHILTGFAPEQVVLLDYAQMRRAPGGVAGTFLRLVDCDLDPATFDPLPRSLSNISPEPLSIYIASLIREGAPPPSDLIATVQAALRRDPPRPTTLLTRTEDERLRAIFRPLNAQLVDRVQPAQPGFTFEEADPPEDMIYRDDLLPQDWAAIAAAFYRPGPPDLRGWIGLRLDKVRHKWLRSG
ncbi:hypothetical protein DXV76_14870 [Rhodobacteraceae bacterium CCMM004]|nr:hypothetical protein DXV76_14870 [Rhodobacteraceae bacterium CCMM004]